MAPATSDMKRRLRKLWDAPDPGTPAGRKQQMGEIDGLLASIKDAELVEVGRNMDARQALAMDDWANAPGVGNTRRRDSEPPEREALRKVSHLLRGGFPAPLQRDEFSHGRLSKSETFELLDLCQRARRGGTEFNATDIPRYEALLEKACGATPGVCARWNEEMVHLNDSWVRKTDYEAFKQAKAEFEDAEAKFAAAKSKVPPSLWGPQF